MTHIPYGRQDITEADIEAVIAVLRSDFLTQGPAVPRFEQAVAAYCGASHAVAVNSATSALHIACLALGLGPGDWLWTSPNTFVASANCGRYCGAKVDFVDIDPRTYNLCPNKLAEKLEQAEREGRLPKVVVPVHFAGQPCDMPAIHALSQRFGFKIIEDASHAIGASYSVIARSVPSTPGSEAPWPEATKQSTPVIARSVPSTPSSEAPWPEATKQSTTGSQQASSLHDAQTIKIGSCHHSHITVFSFHPVKIITTGEGGMALTNDAELANRMARLRTHGITRDPAQMTHEADGRWYYQQIELGFNYRMTDIQAALGASQLQRLDDYITRREALAARYDRRLADLPARAPYRDPRHRSALHLYPIQVASPGGLDRGTVFRDLRDSGIGVNVHYIPVHTQPDFVRLGFKRGDYPHAEAYYENAISLPLYPTMTEAQQDRVVAALTNALSRQ